MRPIKWRSAKGGGSWPGWNSAKREGQVGGVGQRGLARPLLSQASQLSSAKPTLANFEVRLDLL